MFYLLEKCEILISKNKQNWPLFIVVLEKGEDDCHKALNQVLRTVILRIS